MHRFSRNARSLPFVKNSIEFHENPINGLATDIRSQMNMAAMYGFLFFYFVKNPLITYLLSSLYTISNEALMLFLCVVI